MLYKEEKLLLIAGPCALESKKIAFEVAEKLVELQERYPFLNIVFKGSYDKANRLSLSSERGPGVTEGLKILAEIKKSYHLPVLTDIHHPEQAEIAAEVCDVLQIPAFLCRQTDLLVAAAKTKRTVNVKKGQFLAPQDMAFVMEKLAQSHAKEMWQTERGTTFGYQNLVVDMRSFTIMKANGYPVIFDATHSIQLPGAGGGKSSGDRRFLLPLAKAALAAGADGLFLETHPCPAEAISDANSQLSLAELEAFIGNCLSSGKRLL
ncbi:MAG: 3-deoxy-8-phosphooctulonate synthase [Verrucomicrobia bacterium GWC2_42_7]|nr:MAG: 3-deoxy-8-phosphooctulonate synthase [Verrucomicrobia bacterium GWC2_42_7]